MEMVEKILKAQQGDMDAFTWLYEETYSRNYYIVLKMTKNEQDTLDILQDAYVKVYQNIHSFSYTGPSSFASWTSKIASNTALDYLRKKSPVLFSELQIEGEENVMEFELEDESIEGRPDLLLDQKETSQIVTELLECLSEEQRICVIMRYLQEMKISEIAEQCGCSENTVKSRLNYAKKNLNGQREVLERKGIKLFNVAPFALLVLLMGNDASACMVTPIQNAGVGMAQNPVKESLGNVASKGAKHAAKGVGRMGTIVKIIGGVFFVVLVTVGVIVIPKFVKPEKTVPTHTEVTAVPTPEITLRPEEEIFYEYLNETLVPELGIVPSKQNTITDKMGTNVEGYKVSQGILGIDIYDYDQDGKKELFMLSAEKCDSKEWAFGEKFLCRVYEIEQETVKMVSEKVIPFFGTGKCSEAKGDLHYYDKFDHHISIARKVNGEKTYLIVSDCLDTRDAYGGKTGNVEENYCVMEYKDGVLQEEKGENSTLSYEYPHTSGVPTSWEWKMCALQWTDGVLSRSTTLWEKDESVDPAAASSMQNVTYEERCEIENKLFTKINEIQKKEKEKYWSDFGFTWKYLVDNEEEYRLRGIDAFSYDFGEGTFQILRTSFLFSRSVGYFSEKYDETAKSSWKVEGNLPEEINKK